MIIDIELWAYGFFSGEKMCKAYSITSYFPECFFFFLVRKSKLAFEPILFSGSVYLMY